MNIAWFLTLSSVCVYFDKNISSCLDREQEQDQLQDPESGECFFATCSLKFKAVILILQYSISSTPSFFLSVIAEGEESWTTSQGLYLSISIMSIPCLSPVIPHGLAPNTRYAGVWHALWPTEPVEACCSWFRCVSDCTVPGWPMAVHHWLLLETLPDQSSSNTWRDTAALVARWDQQPVPPLSGQADNTVMHPKY